MAFQRRVPHLPVFRPRAKHRANPPRLRPTDLMIQQPDHWDYVGVWAADGRRFFFDSAANKRGEKRIHLYDSETKQITHDLRDGLLPNWSRDGRTAVWTIPETVRYFEMIEDFR